MTDFNLLSAFLIGFAGGVHCIGMCGGIVVALRMASPSRGSSLPFTLMYNTGRIISYTIAGALTGAVGTMLTRSVPHASMILSVLSGVMLILLAMYLGNWYKGLNALESMGQGIFKRIQPYSKRFIPFATPLHALPYGFIWGWLPCGLVYSTLTWSLASSSPLDGALIMLFFGLGTLPTLVAASYSVDYLVRGFKHAVTRQLIASVLLMYAILLIYRAIF